jgi:hypothetical protein
MEKKDLLLIQRLRECGKPIEKCQFKKYREMDEKKLRKELDILSNDEILQLLISHLECLRK